MPNRRFVPAKPAVPMAVAAVKPAFALVMIANSIAAPREQPAAWLVAAPTKSQPTPQINQRLAPRVVVRSKWSAGFWRAGKSL